MTREERRELAIRIATRGRGRRQGRDAADAILDTFYGGLEATARAAGTAIGAGARAVEAVSVAAGEALGSRIQAGAVHVDEYIRNGRPVRSHERADPPGGKGFSLGPSDAHKHPGRKSAPGAHLIYR